MKVTNYGNGRGYKVEMPNGYTVSVIKGPGTYSTLDTSEVAILDPAGGFVRLSMADDVVGYQDASAVEEWIRLAREGVVALEILAQENQEAYDELMGED